MRPVGLAFSERTIRAVEIVRRGRSLFLGKFGSRTIPDGALKEGYVHDKDAVILALSSLQKELGIEFVNMVLPDEKAYLFKTEVPKAAGTDFRQAIEFRLEENVPIKATEAVFDFCLIPGDPSRDHHDVSVTAMPSKVVLTYLEITEAAGLKALSASTEAEALARSIIPKGDLGTFMIVNISENRTGLSIVSRGAVQFNLTVPIGSADTTAAVGKHFSASPEEAVKIKERYGFSKSKENMQLFVSLTNTVSALKDEVEKLNGYWQSHRNPRNSEERRVKKIILAGRDAALRGFEEYLENSLRTPVATASVWQNIFDLDEYIPAIPFLDSLDYASAIGIARPE